MSSSLKFFTVCFSGVAAIFFFLRLPPPMMPSPTTTTTTSTSPSFRPLPLVPISLLVAVLVPVVACCFWSKNKLGTRLRNLIRLLVEILDFGFTNGLWFATFALLVPHSPSPYFLRIYFCCFCCSCVSTSILASSLAMMLMMTTWAWHPKGRRTRRSTSRSWIVSPTNTHIFRLGSKD